MSSPATVVVVAFGIDCLDLRWLPEHAAVIVVHNDDRLNPADVGHRRVRHLHMHANVGFGAAVNAALPEVATHRVVLVNPDMVLRKEHWTLLEDAPEDQVLTLPIMGADDRPTIVVSRYPGPMKLLLMGWRVGRLFRRGGLLRRVPARINERRAAATGAVPVTAWWASAALLSLPTQVLRNLGGFDERFFLYFEDVDLFRRMAQVAPHLVIRVVQPVGPLPSHLVGGSAAAGAVESIRLTSAIRYAQTQKGPGWRAAEALLRARRGLGRSVARRCR